MKSSASQAESFVQLLEELKLARLSASSGTIRVASPNKVSSSHSWVLAEPEAPDEENVLRPLVEPPAVEIDVEQIAKHYSLGDVGWCLKGLLCLVAMSELAPHPQSLDDATRQLGLVLATGEYTDGVWRTIVQTIKSVLADQRRWRSPTRETGWELGVSVPSLSLEVSDLLWSLLTSIRATSARSLENAYFVVGGPSASSDPKTVALRVLVERIAHGSKSPSLHTCLDKLVEIAGLDESEDGAVALSRGLRFLFALADLDNRDATAARGHGHRASVEFRKAGTTFEVLGPLILDAFPDIADVVVEVISDVTTSDLLQEFADWSTPANTRRSAAHATTLLVRHGVVSDQTGPSSSGRDLLEPLEPIAGHTWLNDLALEQAIYLNARQAEREFAVEYARAFARHESMITLRAMEIVAKSLNEMGRRLHENMLRINSTRNQRDQWTLEWRDCTPYRQEKKTGADLGILLTVRIAKQFEWKKALLIQVKKMQEGKRKSGERFWRGSWLIERAQMETLNNQTDASFYWLMSPEDFSPSQRILPASLTMGIVQQATSANIDKPTIGDGAVSRCSHSLAHFLLYDVISGWHGSSNNRLVGFASGDEFPGAPPEYLLRISIQKGKPLHP